MRYIKFSLAVFYGMTAPPNTGGQKLESRDIHYKLNCSRRLPARAIFRRIRWTLAVQTKGCSGILVAEEWARLEKMDTNSGGFDGV